MVNFGVAINGFDAVMDVLDYDGFDTVTYRVGSDTEYDIYVEYGTRKMQAQPYLRPAVNQSLRRIESVAGNADSADEIAKVLAEDIAENARDLAPVDTGRLRDSITVEKK